MKCKYCNASNLNGEKRCFSCGALLPFHSKLNKKDIENLKNYINSVENMLKKAESNQDGKAAMILVMSVIAWISISVFLFIVLNIHFIFTIIIVLILGFVFFMIFGLNFDKIAYSAMKKAFNTKIKYDIHDYLKAMDYTISDFETIAGKVLKDESPLNNFLHDL